MPRIKHICEWRNKDTSSDQNDGLENNKIEVITLSGYSLIKDIWNFMKHQQIINKTNSVLHLTEEISNFRNLDMDFDYFRKLRQDVILYQR